jgi:putative Holliday junction resolvase
MRLLGIDFGFKRIGIAIAETEIGIVTPRAPIEASGTLKIDAAKIAQIAKQEEAKKVILGLPIEESGEEGRMARIFRNLGDLISGHGVVVEFVDERLTSVIAEQTLREEGLKASQRRKLKDGEAAALILERYISEAHPQD